MNVYHAFIVYAESRYSDCVTYTQIALHHRLTENVKIVREIWEKHVRSETVQCDRFIDTFYRPFPREKLPLRFYPV